MNPKIRELSESGFKGAFPRSGYVIQAHGCFDILHVGHVQHLQRAKRMGDILVVTVTSNFFVNKGEGRPFFTENHRAEVLAALQCVDYVAINDAPNAVEAIKLLRPGLFVKGPECIDSENPGFLQEVDAVRSVGGDVAFTDGIVFSSTEIGRRVLALT